MGSNLQGFREKNVRGSSKQDSEVGLAASLMNLLKQGCLGGSTSTTEKRGNKKSHHDPKEKKQHHRQSKQNKGVVQLVTLEEWILASPLPNSREISVILTRMKLDHRVDAGWEDIGADSSFCLADHSGKLKKKVSFRRPEVADVFILDS